MTESLNDIPATVLSELTAVYSENQRKHKYDVLEQNAQLSEVKANVTSSPCAFNDISHPLPPYIELNISINVSKLITSDYCNSCYDFFMFSYTNMSSVIIINYV
jgi:hypothetical protein